MTSDWDTKAVLLNEIQHLQLMVGANVGDLFSNAMS
jgi:hypothetical protein